MEGAAGGEIEASGEPQPTSAWTDDFMTMIMVLSSLEEDRVGCLKGSISYIHISIDRVDMKCEKRSLILYLIKRKIDYGLELRTSELVAIRLIRFARIH